MILRNLLHIWKYPSNYNAFLSRDFKCINQHSFLRFCSSNSHIVQMRGLDYETKEGDVIEFFKPLGITPKAVYLKCDASGRTSAISEVEFSTHAEAVVAMRKRNAFMGNRFIRLTLKSFETSVDSKKAVGNKSSDQNPPSKGELNISQYLERSPLPSGYTIRMKNAPWRMTDQAIYEFFWPVGVFPISSKPIYDESGIRTGEFEVQFLNEEEAFKAMVKNNAYAGNKFVELSFHPS